MFVVANRMHMASAVSDLVGVREKLRAVVGRLPVTDADRVVAELALADVERALVRVSELAGVAYRR